MHNYEKDPDTRSQGRPGNPHSQDNPYGVPVPEQHRSLTTLDLKEHRFKGEEMVWSNGVIESSGSLPVTPCHHCLHLSCHLPSLPLSTGPTSDLEEGLRTSFQFQKRGNKSFFKHCECQITGVIRKREQGVFCSNLPAHSEGCPKPCISFPTFPAKGLHLKFWPLRALLAP